MRTIRRPRHYIARHWLMLARPLLRYSASRDAYVLRGIGVHTGPVLRLERRRVARSVDVERRGASLAR